MRYNARVIVGLVFLFATMWKVIAGQYIDGSFFQLTLIVDGRFFRIARAIAGDEWDILRYTTDAIDYLAANALVETKVRLPVTASLRSSAFALSWGALLTEGMIAALHLTGREGFYKIRLSALWAFVAFTYFAFPVRGFAFILAVLGWAQCRSGDRLAHLAFGILIIVVHLTMVPWQTIVLGP